MILFESILCGLYTLCYAHYYVQKWKEVSAAVLSRSTYMFLTRAYRCIVVSCISTSSSSSAIWELEAQPAGQLLQLRGGLCGDDLARERPVERRPLHLPPAVHLQERPRCVDEGGSSGRVRVCVSTIRTSSDKADGAWHSTVYMCLLQTISAQALVS